MPMDRILYHVDGAADDLQELREIVSQGLDDRGYMEYSGYYYHRDNMAEADGIEMPVDHTTTCRCCGGAMVDRSHYYESGVSSGHADDVIEVRSYCDEVCSPGCAESLGYTRIVGARQSQTPSYIIMNEQGLLQYCAENPHVAETSDEHPYLIGFEVEKEDSDLDFDCAQECFNYGWIAVHDGSLGSYGAEFVSPAYNLTDLDCSWGRRYLQSAIEEMSELDAEASEYCGGHITVSERGKSGIQLAEKLSDFVPLLFALYPNRLLSEYCEPWTRESTMDGRSVKFRAINVKRDRVEFRIFSAVESADQLEWRTRLIDLAIRIADSGSTIQSELENHNSNLCGLLEERSGNLSRLKIRYASFVRYWENGLIDELISRYFDA